MFIGQIPQSETRRTYVPGSIELVVRIDIGYTVPHRGRFATSAVIPEGMSFTYSSERNGLFTHTTVAVTTALSPRVIVTSLGSTVVLNAVESHNHTVK
jgi:hypothetical protein